MTGRIVFAGTILGVAFAVSAMAAPHGRKAGSSEAAPENHAEQLVQSCDAHKFETLVNTTVDGQLHQSKVKLCGKEGQSDADWIVTLKDAITKLNDNKDMPADERQQIVAALNTEISRLEIKSATTLMAPSASSKSSALDNLSPLPPLPAPKQSQAAALAPRQTAPTAPLRDYAALPPLPTTPPPATHVLPGGTAGVAAILPRPRMSLRCYTPGDVEGPCTDFTRDTLITVQAGEDLPADTSLRFVRDGDTQVDVQLAQLKKGKSMRLAVPGDVCRHVVGGKLELRIVRSGQEVGSDGPYNLDC